MGNNKGAVTLIEFDRISSRILKLLTGPNGRMWLQIIEKFLQDEKASIKKDKPDRKQHNESNIEKIYEFKKLKILKFGGITLKNLKYCCRKRHDKALIGEVIFAIKSIGWPTNEETEVELAYSLVEDLGFISPPTIDEIKDKIIKIRFGILTLEQIFTLFYKKDENEPILIPVMDPILLPNNAKLSFRLESKIIGIFNSNNLIPLDTIIVFATKNNE